MPSFVTFYTVRSTTRKRLDRQVQMLEPIAGCLSPGHRSRLADALVWLVYVSFEAQCECARRETVLCSLVMAADVGTEEHRAALMRCLGGPWPEEGPLDAVEESEPEIHEDGYSVQEVSYAVGSGERIRALLLLPDAVREEGAAPRAGICVWHQHHGQFHIGKSEPAGRAGEPMHHTGAALAREGYVVLCPDACVFESRQDPTGTLVGGEFERFEFLRQVLAGRSLAWVAVRDCKRAVDYLASRPEVDADRLGCYGHSLGSTTTWCVARAGPLTCGPLTEYFVW